MYYYGIDRRRERILGCGIPMSNPDFVVRTVKEMDGKDKWIDIGVVFSNTKGGITLYLSSLPFSDKLFLIPVSTN
jgi:hypothetical protein